MDNINCLIEIGQLFNNELSWKAQFNNQNYDILSIYYEEKKYCDIKIKSEKEVAVMYTSNNHTDHFYRNEKYIVGKIIYEKKYPNSIGRHLFP